MTASGNRKLDMKMPTRRGLNKAQRKELVIQPRINRYNRAFRFVNNREPSVTYKNGWFYLGSCNVQSREFERMTLELERRADEKRGTL